jgi:thiamine kinase-like enzyme
VGELNDILQRLVSSLGPLSGETVALDGGITNHNYRATLGGSEYVIRLPGKDTGMLGIDREAERLANDTAARLGIAPAVAATLEDCIVTEFVTCAPVGSGELGKRADEIARALRSFHESGATLPTRFWVPDLLADYAVIVRRKGGALPARYLETVAVATRIEAVLPLRDPRPCHNDLLGGNIIRACGDGRLMIVDWEYAGMGDPRFDLGNVSVNNDFDEAADERLLSAYHGETPSEAQRAALKLMRVLSDAREGAWGVVQREVSELDFDFARYGDLHFERLHAAVEQGPFEEWLATVERAGEGRDRGQAA